MKKSVEKNEELVKATETKVTEAETKVKGLEVSLEESKKSALEKQAFIDKGNDDEGDDGKGEMSEEDVKKAWADGKLPIGRTQ